MRVIRKSIRLGLVAMALVAALGAVLVATHHSDKDAYFEYVATYGNYSNTQAPPVSEGALLAAGNRACEWLGDRPMALWRTDRKWELNSLYPVYRRTLGEADAALPKSFLPGALNYLCPLTTYMHKPHRLRDRTYSDD